jgi:DNA-binding MarR family transcriptional regulator
MRNELTDFSLRMEKVFGVECFSMDTRIILYVVESAACNIKDAQYSSGLSHRGFYLRLKKLVDDGFILVREDSSDGRKRLLAPTEKAKGLRLSLLSMHIPDESRGAEHRLMSA